MKYAAKLLLLAIGVFINMPVFAGAPSHPPFAPQFRWQWSTNGLVEVTFYFPTDQTWQIQVSTEQPVLLPGKDPWQSMRKPFFESFRLGPNQITYVIDPKKRSQLFLRAYQVQ